MRLSIALCLGDHGPADGPKFASHVLFMPPLGLLKTLGPNLLVGLISALLGTASLIDWS
jgi:hypothetical protein